MFHLNKIRSNFAQITKKRLIKFYSDQVNPQTLTAGASVSISRQITNEDIKTFSQISGDTNPVHFEGVSGKAVVHGALLNGLVSGVIGTKLPGPGTLVIAQNLNFPNKCFSGETVKITVKLTEYRKIMKVEFVCEVEEQKKIVLYGDAKLVLNK